MGTEWNVCISLNNLTALPQGSMEGRWNSEELQPHTLYIGQHANRYLLKRNQAVCDIIGNFFSAIIASRASLQHENTALEDILRLGLSGSMSTVFLFRFLAFQTSRLSHSPYLTVRKFRHEVWKPDRPTAIYISLATRASFDCQFQCRLHSEHRGTLNSTHSAPRSP
jgi:hypothetical protein